MAFSVKEAASPVNAATSAHDDVRNGNTTLFTALNIPDGTVIGRCMQKRRQQGFTRFLNAVERDILAAKVVAWLTRHPRWIFHLAPASGSWLNAVENFFSTLTRQRLKRGVFHSVVDLQTLYRQAQR